MIKKNVGSFSCECGKSLTRESVAAPGNSRELTCVCGRKYEIELDETGWMLRAGPLTPEARQPLAGFSRELLLREDCERYFFYHPISGHRLPVHILFSPSTREAEVMTGGRKPFRIAPISSPLDAQRQWVAWFDSLPRKGNLPPRPLRETKGERFPLASVRPREQPVSEG